MAPFDFNTPKLYIEHVPEIHRTVSGGHVVEEQELPGEVVVGVEVNGVRRPLQRFKAGGFLADLARAADESGSGSKSSQSGK